MADETVSAVVTRFIDVLVSSGEIYAFGGAERHVRRPVRPRSGRRLRSEHPFYDDAKDRRVRTHIAGRPTWVHSAEVLAVFKLLFFRPKDLLDVERMVQVQGVAFDRAFVREALATMLGDDERIAKWEAICARNPIPAAR